MTQASTKAKGKKMPTQEFHNLNLEDDDDKSDSGSDDSQSSLDEEWHSQSANITTNICLGLGHELFNMHGHVSKKRKETHKTTEVVALIYINVKQTQTRVLRVLVDTGASATVVLGEHCAKLKV